jgi:hypothetical protein
MYICINKLSKMLIERTGKEVIIRLPSYINTEGLQELVDYLLYKEATAKSKAKQPDIDKLAKEIKKGWWKKNRSRFIK